MGNQNSKKEENKMNVEKIVDEMIVGTMEYACDNNMLTFAQETIADTCRHENIKEDEITNQLIKKLEKLGYEIYEEGDLYATDYGYSRVLPGVAYLAIKE